MELHLKTKDITICGLLITIALILGYIETILPINIGIPGAKIGLANIITFVSLYYLNNKLTIIILLLRIFIIGITFTNLYMMTYSLAGGLLSLTMMIICKRLSFGTITVSIVGGVSHNIGQLLIALLFFDSFSFMYYLPYLMIIGCISGTIIGLISSIIIRKYHLAK